MENTALITNDAIALGLLMSILGFVFWGSSRTEGFWKKFYTYVPAILLCYFLPSVFTSLGVLDPEQSQLYFVASRYLLPTSLVLLTLSVDLKGILRLGPKALIMFFTGTVGIVLGGPIAIFLVSLVSPETIGGAGPEAVWRGMTTVAGSWIGGSANQAAMKEVFGVGDRVFASMVAVDVIIANLWMAVLLLAAGRSKTIDQRTGADVSAIEALKKRIASYQAGISRIPSLADTMMVLAVGFGITALAHAGSSRIAPALGETFAWASRLSLDSTFFWLIVLATIGGVALSFSRARELEGVGASRMGSVLLYVLIATIGMRMDITAVVEQPGLFVVGAVWMLFHAALLIFVAWRIKAPVFFVAVGSQANVGGAASAPVMASAFHPSLASVGVLLAVLGYVVGTFGAWICGLLMQAISAG